MDDFQIRPLDLPPSQVNIAYGCFFHSIGGVEPLTFRVIRGEFPAGIYLSRDGHLSGTPQAEGFCMVTVEAQDSTGVVDSRSYKFYVEHEPRPFPRKIPKDAYGPDVAHSG